jgi:hypothetical protein
VWVWWEETGSELRVGGGVLQVEENLQLLKERAREGGGRKGEGR